jgi:hypothetical protein
MGSLRSLRALGAASLLAVALAACTAKPSGAPSADPETAQMVRLLEGLARNPGKNPFDLSSHLEEVEAALRLAGSPDERAGILWKYADIALDAGKPLRAIEALQEVRRFEEKGFIELAQAARLEMRTLELTAYLRAGELQNCLARHNRDCCIFPIQGGGLHEQREPFLAAEAMLREDLKRNPESRALRWLYTVVSMALGKYPGDVDASLVLSPRAQRPQAPFPRFPEVAKELGVVVDDIAGGTIVDDFTGDGWLDIFLSSWSLEGQLRFFVNRGDGSFLERTQEAGLLGITGGLNMVQADYDNDGQLDLYVVRGAWLGDTGRIPDSLLRNEGSGTFVDRTLASGLLSRKPALSAVWADFTNDGLVDLFVGCESWPGESFTAELYINQGNGRFVECAHDSGISIQRLIRGAVAGDYDNDGWMDLYISCLGEPNLLYRNLQRPGAGGRGWQFEERAAAAGVSEPLMSFPCWFWDYDNDGWLDIFVSGQSLDFSVANLEELARDMIGESSRVEKPRLYRNLGDGTFRDVSREAGLDRVIYAMGANFGDLDNDGYLDFYAGTGDPSFTTLVPNLMFRNAGGRRFEEVTTAGGFGHLQKGHGVAFGDLDNDGDQDIVINMGGAARGDNFLDAVFENPGFGARWLRLTLEGRATNSKAIGARVKVVASGPEGRRILHRSVGSGGSFGASPLRVELGLGSCDRIETIEVFWPGSGKTERYEGAEPDAAYILREGEAQLEALYPRGPAH